MTFNSRDAVTRFHADKVHEAWGGRWLLTSSTGIGKTGQALTALKEKGSERILVVTPAIVRNHWRKEFSKWWAERPSAGTIFAGLGRKQMSKKKRAQLELAHTNATQIVSWNLLPELQQTGWDAIIFDEIHRARNISTKNAQAAQLLIQANSKALVLGLTATPIANEPLDICNIVELLWPGRFGGSDPKWGINKRCKQRYAQEIPSEYALSGVHYSGANPLYMDELRERMGYMMSRTTRQEVSHLLPAFDVVHQSIDIDSIEGMEMSIPPRELSGALGRAGFAKLPFAVEWVADSLVDCNRIAILTYHRELAYQAGAKFSSTIPTFIITGDLPPDMRNEMLAKAAAEPRSITVATMDSIGIGIDMTYCPQVLCLELTDKPEVLMQAFGRFNRFSSVDAGRLTIMSVKGTIDEVVADRTCPKLSAIDAAIGGDGVDNAVSLALGGEEEFLDMIMQAAGSWVNDE